MDRLAELLEQLTLPEMGRVLRRVALTGLVLAIVALGVSIAVDRPLAGLGVCVGLGLGLVNIRLVSASVAKVTSESPARPKRALASHSLVRLGICTAVMVGLALLSLPLGFGTAGGLAAFYVLLVVLLIRSLLGSARGMAA